MTMKTGITMAAEGEGYVAPGPASFDFSEVPLFELGGLAVTKPMVQLILGAVIVFAFFYAAFRRASIVPGRLQFAGEAAYGMVRNSIGRDIIGSKDFAKFVPYLVALFFFLLINNAFASIPAIQFPTFSRASMAYALAGLSWVIYNGVGIHKHGLIGYLKLQSVPSGVSPVMYPLLVPLEFFSNILVRPFTLALRLFATMFAGHLLIILFSLGAEYLIFFSDNPLYIPAGVLSFVAGLVITFLDMLIMFLQAYVFTLLTAMYIGTAIAEEH